MPESPVKKAAVKRPAPKPAGLAGTVVGAHAVHGVAPGGRIEVATLAEARRLHRSGLVTFTHPDGEPLTDGDLVALIEAGF
jgi:xanthine/CO dehydrogenase XdhC/CoxF family maturation factor